MCIMFIKGQFDIRGNTQISSIFFSFQYISLNNYTQNI